jgi:hypothetical protein
VGAEIDFDWCALDRPSFPPDCHCLEEPLLLVDKLVDLGLNSLCRRLCAVDGIKLRRRAAGPNAGEGADGGREIATIEMLHKGDHIAAAEAAAVPKLLSGVDAEPVGPTASWAGTDTFDLAA